MKNEKTNKKQISVTGAIGITQTTVNGHDFINLDIAFKIDGQDFELPVIINPYLVDKKVIGKLNYKLSKHAFNKVK